MKTIELEIKGMTCPSCSAAVDGKLIELAGIESKYINHALDSGKISFDENLVSEEEIIAKINETHYKVVGKEEITNNIQIPECPTCHREGKLVPNTVFKSLLKRENQQLVDLNTKNYICMNPDCETAYYSAESHIPHDALRREIWFKKAAKNKTICYCNNISKEQIKNAVVNHNLETWEDITGLYRSKVIERCENFNPTGSCCRETFAKVVGKMQQEFKNS